MDKNSLAHTKWNCKYHIILTPKYRRKIIYQQISKDIGSIIRTLCARNGVEIIEAAAMPDHIHLYVAIPPKYAVSDFMGYLKGKSSLMIFDRHANLKYQYGNRHFWCRGYYVDTVGRNEKAIREYVRNGFNVSPFDPMNQANPFGVDAPTTSYNLHTNGLYSFHGNAQWSRLWLSKYLYGWRGIWQNS